MANPKEQRPKDNKTWTHYLAIVSFGQINSEPSGRVTKTLRSSMISSSFLIHTDQTTNYK